MEFMVKPRENDVFCLSQKLLLLGKTKISTGDHKIAFCVCKSDQAHFLKVYGLGACFQVELFGFTFLVPSHAFLTPDNMLCDKPTPFVVMQINF